MSFATPDELATHMGLSFTAEDIDRAQLLLDNATGLIQSEARQTIEKVVGDVAELRGTWSRVLQLPERPVTAVSGVTLTDPAGIAVPLTEGVDYSWDRLGRLRRLGSIIRIPRPLEGYWGGELATVALTYTHGYQTAPPDIKAICLSAAARAFVNPEGAQSKQMGADHAVTFASGVGLLASEERTARRYRMK